MNPDPTPTSPETTDPEHANGNGKATNGRRTAAQRERDLATTADLYCRGWTQQAIADEIHVERSIISDDIKAILKRWRESAILDFNDAVCDELARVRHLEAVAWDDYYASGGEETTTTVESTTEGSYAGSRRTGQRKRTRMRDPRFLTTVQWCIERRCKLLGLDAPERLEARVQQEGNDKHDRLAVLRAAIQSPEDALAIFDTARRLAGAPPPRMDA